MTGPAALLATVLVLLLVAGSLRARELRNGYDPIPLWAFLALCAAFVGCVAWAAALCLT